MAKSWLKPKRAKVLSRVSMDMIVVDVTIACRFGDVATLIGDSRIITAQICTAGASYYITRSPLMAHSSRCIMKGAYHELEKRRFRRRFKSRFY